MTPAARTAMIMELLKRQLLGIDEYSEFVYSDQLITEEDALKLLELPDNNIAALESDK